MEPLSSEATAAEYAQALRSVRAAKNLFWWLILLAILAQLVGFILVNFVGVLDYSKGHDPASLKFGTPPTTSPTTQAVPDEAPEAGATTMWYQFLLWMFAACKFVGVVSAILLVIMLMFTAQLSLLGRSGGIAGRMSAVFWSLILLAMAIPWQQLIHSSFASGVLYNLSDLVRQATGVKTAWGAIEPAFLDRAIYYIRYIGYPIVAVLVLLSIHARFTGGLKKLPAAEAPAEPM